MAIDPVANLWAQAADGTEYAYEVGDAVEEDTFAVDGIRMSNFLHPSWFEPFQHPPGTKFDHLGVLKAPFTIAKGGYAGRQDQAAGEAGVRVQGERKALCAGGPPWSSQRISQAQRQGPADPVPTRRKAKRKSKRSK